MLHDLRMTVCVCSEGSALFHIKNVNYIQDLLNIDSNLLTSEEFQGKYNVHTNFLEFAGIRNSVENFLRRCQVNVNNEPIFNCHFPFKIKHIMKNAKGCKVQCQKVR